jgi:hypothetical protein
MNPQTKYSPKRDESRRSEGVAIILKDFHDLLDKHGIEHDTEKAIKSTSVGRKTLSRAANSTSWHKGETQLHQQSLLSTRILNAVSYNEQYVLLNCNKCCINITTLY